ncbi:MAG: MAPEG family protein [Pseudomonadota bacterium]
MDLIIYAALAVFFLQCFLPPLFRFYLRPDPQVMAALGSRDRLEPSLYGERADRALRNMTEAMVLFLPMALLCEMKPSMDFSLAELGGQLFVAGRALYIPCYIFGINVVRTLFWSIGHAGVGLLLYALLTAG